ncbi:hypothetical protein N7457_000374 [Penicillium paradoxum]|uniref:uncharacterized protein n=1 Tax=Penicillium paradoxum TaxID=176176 RepID=UPI00254694F7|nr:uncharacterized protein N7457_000374 [Penicillium paradoxum]KAJ5793775.1 hypothetical protein N7457_000374 [Penicillium paradoxum]
MPVPGYFIMKQGRHSERDWDESQFMISVTRSVTRELSTPYDTVAPTTFGIWKASCQDESHAPPERNREGARSRG